MLIRMGTPTSSVTKTGRLIIPNLRDICSTVITREQYLWEQIKSWTGHLEDIFIDMNQSSAKVGSHRTVLQD